MKNVMIVLLWASCMISGAKAQTRIVAHYGNWGNDPAAQCSIEALQKTAQIRGCASEFDVVMTADGTLVVNQSDSLGNSAIQDISFSNVKALSQQLNDPVCTLDEYLAAGKAMPNTKLILVLAPMPEQQEDLAVRKLLVMVRKYQLQDRIEYVSESLNACKGLMNDPRSVVSYEKGDLSPQELKNMGFAGMDYHYTVYEKHPEWIKQAQDLGLTVNVWTVNDVEQMRHYAQQKVDYITTDKPEQLAAVLARK